MDVAGSVDELLAGATDVTAIDSAGKSGARLERVSIGGEPHVVKYLDPSVDWTMRAAGVDTSATLELWRRGVLARLPTSINQPIVGVAYEDGVTAMLMHDVGEWLVPVSDDVVPLDQHLRFLDHMAHMHATFWQTPDDIDVVSNRTRYTELSPQTAEREAALGSTHAVPPLIGAGWPRLAEVARRQRPSSPRSPSIRRRSSTLSPEHPRRWFTATGSSTIWAPTRRSAPSCSTGSCQAVARRPATSRGTSPSTAAVSRSRRRTRSAPTARHWIGTASTRSRGGHAS